VYQSIWPNPLWDDELTTEWEPGNAHDTHAVAIRKNISGVLTTVGHVPKTISRASSIFIRRGGAIQCMVNGHRHYSVDLEKGGLEIPCILTYIIDDENEFTKTKTTFNVKLGLETADSVAEFLDASFVSEESTLPAAMKSTCSLEGSVSTSTVDLTAHCSTLSPAKRSKRCFAKKK